MAVRQITTRLAIDGEQEYKKQLAAVNRELGNLGAEMKLVDAQFKGQANSSEALRAKHDLLKQSIEQQVGKIVSLEGAVAEATAAFGEADARTDSYRRQLLSAETALAKLNDELVENEKYLDEAEQSADGCAKSIDGFGKSVKEADRGAQDASGAFGGLGSSLEDLKGAAAKGDLGGVVESLGSMKGLLVGGAIAAGIKEIADQIWDISKAAAAYADDILTMSTVTGISTDELQEYKYMADLVDVSLDTITGSITKLTRNMLNAKDGTGEQAEAFAALGIQITNADGSLRDAREVFDEVITALGQMSNETERDAYAMVLMGKSAQDLNPLIEAGAEKINALRQEAHETGYVLDEEMLSTLGELQDSFDRFDKKMEAFKNNLAVSFAPAITTIVNALGDAIVGFGNFITAVNDAIVAIDNFFQKLQRDANEKNVERSSTSKLSRYRAEARLREHLSGSHAAGLDRVPYDGYLAELHADEAVLNAQEAALWRSVERSGARALPSAYSPAALPAAAQGGAQRESVTIDVTLELDGQTLARKQYPLMQAEGRRRGTPLAGKEGT